MPKIVDHELYRQELLSKCFDIFAQKGYRSVTMRQIAQELGVSTGTLYHYFPSKKELFWQLYEELCQRDMDSAIALLSEKQTLSEKIDTIFKFLAQNEDYFCKQTLITCDFLQQNGRDEVIENEIVKRNSQFTTDVLSKLLGIQDPALLNFIMSTISGAVIIRLFEGDTLSYAEQSQLLAKMLTAYLESQNQ